MVLLEPDPFLNELAKLFSRTKDKSAVFVTMKRSSLKARKGKAVVAPADHVCLVRATDGKRKISTHIRGDQHAKFAASYALILRAQMDALKKREKVRVKREPAAGGGGGGKAGGGGGGGGGKAGGGKAAKKGAE